MTESVRSDEGTDSVVSAACVEPDCSKPATESFVGHKKGREPITFRTCRDHKFPVSLGLIKFGLADEIEYDKEHVDAAL